MCGIAGRLQTGRATGQLLKDVRRMCAALTHRGPDGNGFWSDQEAGLTFGHNRLSIVDLSERGHQPMQSADGRYCLTYNGELYNTEALRQPLLAKGIVFQGSSDTEVLVNTIAVYGLEKTLQQLNGIYAFAVWDRKERSLYLVRDRLGVKPLFYAQIGSGFAFASEVRALSTVEGFDRNLDNAGIGCFLQYNSIRAPLTIYRGARALEAGSVLSLSTSGEMKIRRYWDLGDVERQGRDARSRIIDDREAIDSLEELLYDSVNGQLVSDVPIGCFLSGGIDSSIIASLMQKARSNPIRTFSIGFDDPSLDEARYAKAVAKNLGTEHTELYVSSSEVLDTFPNLVSIYDQPVADMSMVPTYLLCRMAREHVTVALSGDGGDELFYGYSRFTKAQRARRMLGFFPTPIRRSMAAMVNRAGGRNFRAFGFQAAGKVARTAWHASRLLEFSARDTNDAYLHFTTHWSEPTAIAPLALGDFSRWESDKVTTENFDELMMLYDAKTFMTEQVLAKVDRASMAVSLEVRVPLLDHRIVEHAWQMPQNLKFRESVGKWGLRQVLYRHVPRELVDRPKAGFAPPLGAWMRGPLRDWCEDLLSEKNLSEQGVLDPTATRCMWNAHLKGNVDISVQLWPLLMLQAWLAENGSGKQVSIPQHLTTGSRLG